MSNLNTESATDSHEALFEQGADAIAVVDLDDRRCVRDINRQFEAVFSCDRESVAGRSLFDIVGADVEENERVEAIEPTERTPVRKEVCRATSTGEGVFLFRFIPQFDDEEPASSYAIYTDITEQAEETKRQHNREQYRKQLYRITSDTSLSDEQKRHELLALGCERLGVENGHIVEIDEKKTRHEVVTAFGSNLVEADSVTDLSETYCRRTVESEELLSIHNAERQGMADDVAYNRWNIGCYFGGKIIVDDELFGTVCFVNEQPREEPFTHDEKVFLDLVIRWISHLYERQKREQELKQTSEMLEQSQRLAEIGAWELVVEDGEPTELLWTEEVYRIHDHPRDATVTLETGIEYYHPDDQPTVKAAVEQAIDRGKAYELEGRVTLRTGEERWVRCIGKPLSTDGEVRTVRGSIQDITERKQREQELERTKTLLDQTERLASVGGWEVTDQENCPIDGTQTDGLYAIHELSPEELFPVDRHTEFVHPEDRARVTQRYDDLLDAGKPFDFETRIRTAEENQRWVRSLGVPVIEDGEIVAHRGAMVDITDRKAYEQALTSLHEMARKLLRTKTDGEVADLVVSTASEILNTSAIGIYQLDTDRRALIPTTATAGFRARCGEEPAVPVGEMESPLWRAFATGEQTTVELPADNDSHELLADDETESHELSADDDNDSHSGLVVPLGEYGVFVLLADEQLSQQLIETLAATAETAFARFSSEAALKERDAQLKAQNERLEREIQINQIIRLIDQSIIDATSQSEIETAVCERLVECEEIAFAWIGTPEEGGRRIEPRVWAGREDGYLDAVGLTEEASEPSLQAARTKTVRGTATVIDRLQEDSWATDALARNFHSIVSAPLAVDTTTYGVLSVYAAEPNAFLDRERSVFEELAANITHAINWVQTRQTLAGETALELELAVDSTETVLGQLARTLGCQIAFEGLAAGTTDSTRMFFSTAGADAATVQSMLAELHSVTESVLVTESAESCLFEATVTERLLAEQLLHHGGHARLIHADAEETTVVVTLPKTTDVRELLEALQAEYPSLELRARRNVDQPRYDHSPTLLAELTERQQEVLRTAYLAGFFDTPRGSSAEAIAEMLDITQPTVSRHLRRAQKRLLGQLFDGQQ